MGRPSCDNRRDAVRAREEVERAARGRPERRGPEEKPDFQYRRESGIGGKSIALIVAALLLVIFFLQNLENANIDFLFWEWDVGIAVAIGLAALSASCSGGASRGCADGRAA